MAYEGMQIGHYRLLRLLGNDARGRTYLAEDRRIERQVVITVYNVETPTFFPAEVKTIVSLDHPHILPILEIDTEGINGTDIIYLVMPFCLEGSLKDLLQQRDTAVMISLEDIEHFLYQSADALQYAHDHELIHQNVKPSNLLIRRRKEYPARPDLLVTGFRTGTFIPSVDEINEDTQSTIAYIAPEQWNGQPVPATDQYALAALAYELLVGFPPFQGTPQIVRYHHLNSEPIPPSVINSRIPPALERAILQALAKKPENRFPSILAFAEAFRQALLSDFDKKEPTLPIKSFDNTQPITPMSMLLPESPPPPPILNLPDPVVPGKRRRLSQKETILLVALIFFLLGASFSFLFTRIPNQKALSNALTQITAIDKGVKSSVTTQTNATATDIASSYPFSNRLLLNDPLSSNSQHSQWEQDSNDVGNCAFQEGAYHITATEQGHFRECIAITTNFSNFTYEVRMTIIKGDCGGIIFRRSGPHFYYFRVCADGSYYFIRYMVDADSPLNQQMKYGSDPAIHTGPGATNIVAVVANGKQFDLYMNRQFIGTVFDTTFTSGQIGLVAKEGMHSTEVAFSDAVVWEL